MVMGQASQHNYSAHMSTSLALGFLFMAGGGATFSSSPQATAALVIALFPRFPHSPTDHRCHLQVRAATSADHTIWSMTVRWCFVVYPSCHQKKSKIENRNEMQKKLYFGAHSLAKQVFCYM